MAPEDNVLNSRQRAQTWPFPRHKTFVAGLREAAAAWFEANNLPTHSRMPYCLAEWADWRSNIILPEVADYITRQSAAARENNAPFPLHKYLHHGLSSQAMAFNLLGPLVTRNDYQPLSELFRARGVPGSEDIRSACFEYDDRKVFNEDAGQPTSIDIVLHDAGDKPRVFIEAKLVEQEFGGCSVFAAGDCSGKNPVGRKDDCFLHFIGRKYWPLMAHHGITASLAGDTQCIFTTHYQFFRELLLAVEKGGVFVLLSDERSPVFHCRADKRQSGLMPFLTGLLPESLRARVVSISIQEAVEYIKSSSRHDDWISAFEKKYGLAS